MVVRVRLHEIRRDVAVEGEEVQRTLPLLDEVAELHETAVAVRLRLRHGLPPHLERDVVRGAFAVAADLQMRELRLEVLRRDVVQLAELPPRAEPHRIAIVRPVVRLVPDFPIRDLPLVAVRPAFGVVADHVLADAGPFREVLRRKDAVRLANRPRVVLDRHAQAEVRFHTVVHKCLEVEVGEDEVVVLRVVLVRVEIAEDVGDVHPEVLSEHAADVVQPRVRHAGLLQVAEHGEVRTKEQRSLTDGVHRLDGPRLRSEVDLDVGAMRRGKGRASRNRRENRSNQFLHFRCLR